MDYSPRVDAEPLPLRVAVVAFLADVHVIVPFAEVDVLEPGRLGAAQASRAKPRPQHLPGQFLMHRAERIAPGEPKYVLGRGSVAAGAMTARLAAGRLAVAIVADTRRAVVVGETL
jgi:hypothetical protein